MLDELLEQIAMVFIKKIKRNGQVFKNVGEKSLLNVAPVVMTAMVKAIINESNQKY
ncbi:hypothetical protein [Haemophilus parainfluenzae]|uniref:hypothetical protein n=1 Tax=Haemophilus parainfluenzae TaxID=729 RepID=UPI001E57C159|nr:hypothetical protein [Haemophilus parainfluenzae]